MDAEPGETNILIPVHKHSRCSGRMCRSQASFILTSRPKGKFYYQNCVLVVGLLGQPGKTDLQNLTVRSDCHFGVGRCICRCLLL